jgi:hypothetical protein
MKLFKCQNCGQLLYFENTLCESCGHALGFSSDDVDLLTLRKIDSHRYNDVNRKRHEYRYCANSQHNACNWLIPANSSETYCIACKLNHTIPDLNVPEHVANWRKLEVAKHRLVYTLLRLGLPVSAKADDPRTGLSFDFLADTGTGKKVMTGHDDGLITINLSEADEATRVRNREKLGEPYRTLLGHFRHESGHYYWDRIVANTDQLNGFRKKFGDEQADYAKSLARYYKQGPAANWENNFISAYASSHPWEDWAETWAHYLHVMDTIETAFSFGMRIKPEAESKVKMLTAEYSKDPFEVANFQKIIELWFPITVAVNSLNRSMGQPDFYPFVTMPAVIEKLKFIHEAVYPSRRKGWFQ